MRNQLQGQKRQIPGSRGYHATEDPEITPASTPFGLLLLALGAGLLVPMLSGSIEIALRQAVTGVLAQPYLSVLSFGLLALLYFTGYRLVWQVLLHFYRFANPFALLRFGTLIVVFASIVNYAFLFQPENAFSNIVWFLFFAISDIFFYTIGRVRINRY